MYVYVRSTTKCTISIALTFLKMTKKQIILLRADGLEGTATCDCCGCWSVEGTGIFSTETADGVSGGPKGRGIDAVKIVLS